MKRLTYYYKAENHYALPVTDHQFLLRCVPRMNACQHVLSVSVLLSPDISYTQQHDSFGNLQQIGCIGKEHHHFTYTAIGEVAIDFSHSDTASLHPMYKYPSALTSICPTMMLFVKPFQSIPNTLETLLKLNSAVYHHILYTPEATDVHTRADMVFNTGEGLCQDYAHVLIASLRSMGIPARYACGLSVGEGITHAWAQAYMDNGWIGLDPTRNTPIIEQYVTFAVGRDAADCPIDRGINIGSANHKQTVYMRLMEQ